MKKIDSYNGLSRQQYLEQGVETDRFNALENDWKILMLWLTILAERVHYYNQQNEKEGSFAQLFENQLLVILIEISLFDTENCKKEFIRAQGTIKHAVILNNLREFIKDKSERLRQYIDDFTLYYSGGNQKTHDFEEIASVILERFAPSLLLFAGDETQSLKIPDRETRYNFAFFKMLDTVKEIQGNYSYYADKIEHSGMLDPAVSVLVVFLRNYARIMEVFNRKFRSLPGFYLEHIIKARKRGALPDRTWIVLQKTEESDSVYTPKKIRFTAGKNQDGTPLYYASQEAIKVSKLELSEVHSIVLEQKTAAVPVVLDSKEVPVTSVYRKQIPLNDGTLTDLFDNNDKNSTYTPIGWMMESPILILREGKRFVRIRLALTAASLDYLAGFLNNVCSASLKPEEIVKKIFDDAFYAKLSGAEGWMNAKSCRAEFDQEGGCMQITFFLSEDMPATSLCTQEIHGQETDYPALQLTLNKNAWFFPYSWASCVAFEKLNIHVRVTGITSVKLYNDYGELDASVPFYPFGVQAKKGAWLVFGNYEMSQKPLNKVTFSCRWQQLPESETGFEEHYALYRTPKKINNHSFKVQPECLTERKWKAIYQPVILFGEQGESAQLAENGSINFEMNGQMPVVYFPEERFVPGKVRNGFLRILLSDPEMGFGSERYRQVFADTMIRNSRKKEPEPLPKEPVSPMMSEIELDYEAEEAFAVSGINRKRLTRFYHIRPFSGTRAFPVSEKNPVVLAQKSGSSANLMFAFQNAIGADSIRLFLSMSMRKDYQEYRTHTVGRLNARWYYNKSGKWHLFPSESVLQDTTSVFTNSGIVELLLPSPVQASWLDEDGKFRLWVAIEGDYKQCQLIGGFYQNALEVVAEGGDGKSLPCGTITQSERSLPGIKSVVQIVAGYGGCPAEDEKLMSIRMAHRVSHRNRAITPPDFEQIVLEQFPSVEKVKCITATEFTDGKIRLVIMSKEQGGIYPLCSLPTLREIKNRLFSSISSFANLEVINPFYEKMRVHCQIKLRATLPTGDTLRRLNTKINRYIAPWLNRGDMPFLGRGMSMKGLFTILVNDHGVSELIYLSVQLIDSGDGKDFYLRTQADQSPDSEDVTVRESYPWGVFIPADHHLIEYEIKPEEQGKTGIGDLYIDDNFIIE